jgi:TctA family transporter
MRTTGVFDQPGGRVVVVVVEAMVVVVEATVVVVVVEVVDVEDATVVVVGATVVFVGGDNVVEVVVDVVVVVGVGITNPFAQPQRISIGAPRGIPAVAGMASSARRNCAHASHAEIPVVGQPPLTCEHAAVCTVSAAKRRGIFISNARAARTAHCFDSAPLLV